MAGTGPYRLLRDDMEDEEMDSALHREGMPTTISGFKDHPIYVLVRHLRKNETLYPAPPDTPELGTFRGETVYPRSCVITLKTPDTWMRTEGRVIKSGEQPLKFTKMRSSTIARQRELEVLKEGLREAGHSEAEQEVMQGVYGRMQTELYVPPPVINGKIPKNDFGNIDLYVPSMLPAGAVHVPYKGVSKVAKKMGIEYADAVTRFEFKKRSAVPVLEGVVIARENEHFLLDAYWEAEQDAQEKARLKRMDKAIKQWTRLVHGLRIRQRLQAQYGTGAKDTTAEKKQSESREEDGQGAEEEPICDEFHGGGGGGFLVGAGDVVAKYQLPKTHHLEEDEGGSGPSTLAHRNKKVTLVIPREPVPPVIPAPEAGSPMEAGPMDVDGDEDMEEVDIPAPEHVFAPKSLEELAKEMDTVERAEIQKVDSPKKVTLRFGPTASPKARPKPKANANGKGKGKKRKRADEVDEDDDEVEVVETVPAKRKRAVKTATPTAASTRTLRPRKSKTVAQEEAWNAALGGDEDEE